MCTYLQIGHDINHKHVMIPCRSYLVFLLRPQDAHLNRRIDHVIEYRATALGSSFFIRSLGARRRHSVSQGGLVYDENLP